MLTAAFRLTKVNPTKSSFDDSKFGTLGGWRPARPTGRCAASRPQFSGGSLALDPRPQLEAAKTGNY